MQITITLTGKETAFLQKIAEEMKILEGRDIVMEDAMHECLRMAMYEESEEGI